MQVNSSVKAYNGQTPDVANTDASVVESKQKDKASKVNQIISGGAAKMVNVAPENRRLAGSKDAASSLPLETVMENVDIVAYKEILGEKLNSNISKLDR